MKLFDFLKRKGNELADGDESYEEFSVRLIENFQKNDHLGQAAIARKKARAAKAAGDFNSAWALYQEMKEHYMLHADRCGFTPTQTLALDSSVSQPLADILRLEGKHHDALVHIVYWAACDPRPSKVQQQKLCSYFNRCKFKNATLEDLESFVLLSRSFPDFTRIRNTISAWRDLG